jgi:hypothetical protein
MQTLIIVARRPLAGATKTRLCPPLDGETAAALYECFLRDTLLNARRVPGVQPVIIYTPEDAGSYFAELAPDFQARPQHGADLGHRLAHAFDEALAVAETRAVAIGTDSPDLPHRYISGAFALLAGGADLVLGPADDGGYYLIGLRRPQPRLFHEVPMSTASVLKDTLTLARELGLRSELLPPWYDIDTHSDLRRFQANVERGDASIAPNTRAFLAQSRFLGQVMPNSGK